MIYYGIVDNIKPEHKTGVYGKVPIGKREANSLLKDFALETFVHQFSFKRFSDPFWIKHFKSFLSKTQKIALVNQISSSQRQLIFDSRTFKNNYALDKTDNLLYGLFDDIPNGEEVFEKILKSKGGSSFIIIERDSISNNRHFAGESEKLHSGLYCSHPKDEKKLIPLIDSNQLISSLILEETIRAYEALGAKSILIQDITEVASKAGGKKNGITGEVKGEYNKVVLRKKAFGKGTFDPGRALNDNLFIHDIPAVITTIQGRINGNQTIESFCEEINLSIGLDIGVLDVISANANFEYKRKWQFDIEFYDKNEVVAS